MTPRRQGLILIGLIALVSVAWEGYRQWEDQRMAERIAAAARPGDIRMLSSETCVFCTRARQWLTQHRIPFQECFIERDAVCAADFRALRAPGTPVLIVRQQMLVGFQPERVAQALTVAPAARQSPSEAGSPRP